MATARFFEEPDAQNIIKTKLVAKYFGAWTTFMLPRLRRPGDRLAYIDLFAGPGRFSDGKASTPLWILNNAISRPELCSRLVTTFNDKNPDHVTRLRTEIDALPGIEKLAHRPQVSNVTVGSELVALLRNLKLVPTLFFIDPWGYKGLSLDLIGTAIKNWGCDCIFFFNYNRINPGLTNPAVFELINDLFGTTRAEELRGKVAGLSSDERQTTIIDALTDALGDVGGKHVLPFEFQSSHGVRTSHYIIFVTKSFRGYDIMKDIMFGMSSDSEEVRNFKYAPSKAVQLRLGFDPARPHSIPALKQLILRECAGKVLTVKKIYEEHSVDTPYIERHFKDALKSLETEHKVTIEVPADKRRKNTLADHLLVTVPG